MWLLGSSCDSARLAAQLGLPYCYAHFINPADAEPALEAYRNTFRASGTNPSEPVTMCAVLATCASTHEAAVYHAASTWLWGYRAACGSAGPVSPSSTVYDDANLREGYERVASSDPRLFTGEPSCVIEELTSFAHDVGADELMIATIIHDQAARQDSLRLLAGAANLTPRTPTAVRPRNLNEMVAGIAE
jgi:alkanesulfonate monooxygenase SsuD/methylene tetrahydromethanopterin reductase-like flavin-dependent oxidoreductase (luciferase family)